MKRRAASRTRGEETESRLTRLETDMKYIKEQVSNHIPTTLSEHGTILESIQRKVGDVDAISRFLSVCLKFIGVVVTTVWSVKKLWPGHD